MMNLKIPSRYELLLEAVDGIVRESYGIRQMMGLPEKENDDLPDDFSEYKNKIFAVFSYKCHIALFHFCT